MQTFCQLFSFIFLPLHIVSYPDLVAGRAEGVPGDVQPARTCEQLVGIFPRLEEVREALELPGVEWSDVGSLADEVLGVFYASHLAVHDLTTETGVDDDRPHKKSGRLQQHDAAIGQVRHGLHRRDILRMLLQVQELVQSKVRR